MAKQSAVLIAADGTRAEMQIENADTVGVIIRVDTRKKEPWRVFRYRPGTVMVMEAVATFDEVDFTAVTELPGLVDE
jgi:hypothetical protein